MFITYIVVTILAAAANIFSAMLDFIRYEPILNNMAKVGVSESWITTLGILKAAGALGLLIGIGAPAVGITAAAGLVLFFIAAIFTHVRGHDYSFGLAIVFLLLAIAALEVRLVSSSKSDIRIWSGGMPSEPRAIRSKSRAGHAVYVSRPKE